MNKKQVLRWAFWVALVIAITGGIVVYRIFTKPHRDVSTETAVTISAQALYQAFKTDEAKANAAYLDKAVQVSGEILDISTNQDQQVVINFKTDDPLVVVNCTFKDNPGALKAGDQIAFKGICTGYIPDANVVINAGVLIPQQKP